MNNKKITCMNCPVRGCTVLRNCEERLLHEIDSKKSWLVFKKGQRIASSRMYFQGIYVISSGVAKIYQKGAKGREFIFRLVKEGDLFGYRMNSEESLNRLVVDAVEDCRVCFIDKDEFEKVSNDSREVREQLMMFYHTELSDLLARTCNLMQMNVRGRIAETLLYVRKAYEGYVTDGENIRISLSRQELADLAGTTKEQVSRTMSEFKSMGFINVSGKSFGLADPSGLRMFTNYGES